MGQDPGPSLADEFKILQDFLHAFICSQNAKKSRSNVGHSKMNFITLHATFLLIVSFF